MSKYRVSLSDEELHFTRETCGDDICRPVVVLDLNEQSCRRVIEVLCEKGLTLIADMIAEQIRPKPDEPLGLGAVVEDAEGVRWTRIPNKTYVGNWYADRRGWHNYTDIRAVRLLAKGVQ